MRADPRHCPHGLVHLSILTSTPSAENRTASLRTPHEVGAAPEIVLATIRRARTPACRAAVLSRMPAYRVCMRREHAGRTPSSTVSFNPELDNRHCPGPSVDTVDHNTSGTPPVVLFKASRFAVDFI